MPPRSLDIFTNDLWVAAYRKYIRFWINLARTSRLSNDEAADVVHTVILNILADPRCQLTSMEHLRNYVSRSVVNRAMQLRQRLERRDGWDDALEERFAIEQDTVLIDRDRLRELYRAGLRELPENDFRIIKLRFFSGLTFCEISSLLGLSISTLKSREEAALKRLRKRLQDAGF